MAAEGTDGRGRFSRPVQQIQILTAFFVPTLALHAYNPLASVAGVFRETFAGRRGPALSFEP
jgi:hypothetical protein